MGFGSNYTGNPTAVEAPSPAPGPGVAPVIYLPSDLDGATWANLFQAFKTSADFIAWLTQRIGSPFGNGQDGSATLDGTATVSWASKVGSVYTLTRDVFLNNLTVTGAGLVVPSPYRLYGIGTLTTAIGGYVSADGTNASGSTHGGNGADGVTASNGNASANQTNAMSSAMIGGAGGNSSGNTGGAAGTVTALASTAGLPYVYNAPTLGSVYGNGAWTVIGIGSGGGGGAGTSTATGGGGGGAGGVLPIAFRYVSLASAGDLHCKGGNGGNATATGGGSGGGGGGGAGGTLLLYYVTLNQTLSAATNCPGGSGGSGAGTGGLTGSTGSNGTVIAIQMGT